MCIQRDKKHGYATENQQYLHNIYYINGIMHIYAYIYNIHQLQTWHYAYKDTRNMNINNIHIIYIE